MKNKNIKLLTILSAGALVMGLASCGENTNSSAASEGTSETSSEVQSSSSIIKIATRINRQPIGYVVVGQKIDLDEYVTVVYDDKTTDKNYQVSCSNKNVSISEHKVTALEHGEYTLNVAAGSVKIKITLTVVSAEQKELIDFLAPLSESSDNYTTRYFDIIKDDEGYKYSYNTTVVHNENYVVWYDEYNPTGNDEDGNSTSMLLAKLEDGHTYTGYFSGTDEEPVPTFKPGYTSWGNYYATQALSLDATDATYETAGTEEYLFMSATFAKTLFNYGVGYALNSNYSYTGAIYEGIVDIDEDGTDESALFDIYITDGTKTYILAVALSDIGTSKMDVMEPVSTDKKYIPTKIDATEISTAFTNLAAGKNYTVTTELTSVDSDGKELTTITNEDSLANIAGSTHVIITTTFTDKGVISVYKALEITKNEDGTYSSGTDWVTTGGFAYWDDGTNTYSSGYTTEGKWSAKKTAVEGKTAYDSGKLDTIVASNVTSKAANSVNWSGKETDGTKVTFSGDVGDNDGTEVTNQLFGQIFNMNGFAFEIITKGGAGLGTEMTSSVKFDSDDYHALTLYSTYNYFTVDTATNEVYVDALCYLPIRLKNYVDMKFSVSEVGTTTNDFNLDFAEVTE